MRTAGTVESLWRYTQSVLTAIGNTQEFCSLVTILDRVVADIVLRLAKSSKPAYSGVKAK